jgi:hypothetical protein
MFPMIGKVVSHLEVLEHPGGGEMGVVSEAEDTELDRPVALKFCPTSHGIPYPNGERHSVFLLMPFNTLHTHTLLTPKWRASSV